MQVREYEGKALRYLAVEPDDYQPDRRYPMVILLHGFGSHMGDLTGLCPAIDKRGYLYAFPNAPIPLQVGYGEVGYGWVYPPESDQNRETQHSAENLASFFEEVMGQYRVEPGQAVLGGFSQGGMMTYLCGLPNPHLFLGLAALSARIPDPDALRSRLPASRAQPVFIAHGTGDTVIPLEYGQRSRRFLETCGYEPEYREYEMGHEITQNVIEDLAGWVRRVLPPVVYYNDSGQT